MSEYIARPQGEMWYTELCPHEKCDVIIRSRKIDFLPRAVKIHIARAHDGEMPLEPIVKRVDVVAVYYSGDRKKLSQQVPPFRTAIVSGDFPGGTGCAVVRSPDEILIYPGFTARAKGWKIRK